MSAINLIKATALLAGITLTSTFIYQMYMLNELIRGSFFGGTDYSSIGIVCVGIAFMIDVACIWGLYRTIRSGL